MWNNENENAFYKAWSAIEKRYGASNTQREFFKLLVKDYEAAKDRAAASKFGDNNATENGDSIGCESSGRVAARNSDQPVETPVIREIAVGRYTLRDHKLKVGCITIMGEGGEGGTFDEAELEKVIGEFYAKHF